MDIVNSIKKEILKAMPDVSPTWAEYCAIAPLSTILHEAVIVNRERPLRMNLFMMMIGYPGIKKSMPMTSIVTPIINRLSVPDELDMELLLPSRYSVEGFIHHVNEGGRNGVQRRDVGIIVRDEFSGMFKQLRNADWQSDGMEFISEMYDGSFHKRATVTGGLQLMTNLYACMITATTPYFLSEMDPMFFIQGTGNRFLYNCMTMEEYEPKRKEDDYFDETWVDYRENKLTEFVEVLSSIYRRGIRKIYAGTEAGLLWRDYSEQYEKEWKKEGLKDELGWKHHPMKRRPELALKLAGIYAVSERSNIILGLSDEKWDDIGRSVSIEKKHMERAIAMMELNAEHFKKIINIKEKLIPRTKPESKEDEARALMMSLHNSKYGMLTVERWREQQDITSNSNKFLHLRNILLNKGLVEIIPNEDVPKEVKIHLNIQGTATKVYRCVEKK